MDLYALIGIPVLGTAGVALFLAYLNRITLRTMAIILLAAFGGDLVAAVGTRSWYAAILDAATLAVWTVYYLKKWRKA
jgi:hypothetical protein